MRVAILVISDTRTLETDSSGVYLTQAASENSHTVVERSIVKDNQEDIRNQVSRWLADECIDVIVCTGGTGFSSRDNTPEAIKPLLEQSITGFGELFRWLSYEEIGSSTIQSRACAGIAKNTLIFALPGSTNACKLAWEKILKQQLNPSHEPCNFAELITKMKAYP